MKIKSVRGTHDFLPGTVELWQNLETTARRILEAYGYGEIRTPILEETELFARSIGPATDIVQKEMYTFTDSKGKKISLRPEGTASVVRAFIEHALYHDKIANRLYYIGPMFRHERPQKGRYRQFHQIGAEVLGSDHPAVEAESVELLERLFSKLGLTGLRLLINSLGCPKCRPAYLKLLSQSLSDQQVGLCSECEGRSQTNPLRVFDCKVPSCQPLIERLPKLSEHLCQECRQHFAKFQQYLGLFLPTETFVCELAPRLVRGLDYYVRTTFEVVSDRLGPTQNAVAGGGRYDGLSEILGGPPTEGFGFALGMERLVLLLSGQEEVAAAHVPPAPEIFLAYLDEPLLEEALKLARELRRRDIFAYVDFDSRSLKAQMRLAGRLRSRFVCVIGTDEITSGRFAVKRMEDGSEVTLSREQIARHVKRAL